MRAYPEEVMDVWEPFLASLETLDIFYVELLVDFERLIIRGWFFEDLIVGLPLSGQVGGVCPERPKLLLIIRKAEDSVGT